MSSVSVTDRFTSFFVKWLFTAHYFTGSFLCVFFALKVDVFTSVLSDH